MALDGSGKVVKVYSTADGSLQYKSKKYTDWITADGFSPDGAKLATADLAGGQHLWDAKENSLKKFNIECGLRISTAIAHDGNTVIGCDSKSKVRFWRLK